MRILPNDTKVSVSGPANQWPFERICDTGVILGHTKRGYLVRLIRGRENLIFKRRDLTVDFS